MEGVLTINEFMHRYDSQMDVLSIFDRDGVELDDDLVIPHDAKVIGYSRSGGWWQVKLDIKVEED